MTESKISQRKSLSQSLEYFFSTLRLFICGGFFMVFCILEFCILEFFKALQGLNQYWKQEKLKKALSDLGCAR